MLGIITGVFEKTFEVYIKAPHTLNFMNRHVVVENGDSLIIGDPLSFKNNILTCIIIGSIINNQFIMGSVTKPTLNKNVRQITDQEINTIVITSQTDYQFEVGTLPNFNSMRYLISINEFFSNHFAILGNTGSGKSCTVARILQNVYQLDKISNQTNFIIFDAFGEYENAFINLEDRGISFKRITTNINQSEIEILRIPLWLLGVDDIALLLSVEKASELNIIEKALKLVNVFAKDETTVINQKNSIIAKTIADIINSGKPSAVIRDQIIGVLSTFHTATLNLETEVKVPGWTRSLKQCLIIDKDGKMTSIEVLTEFIHSLIDNNTELSLPDGTFSYNLNDFKIALDFALISEGLYNSEKRYDDLSVLSIRLNAIINSTYSSYFEYPTHTSLQSYINNIFTKNNGKASIVNFNINQLDDRFAKIIVKIFSKLFFDTATNIMPRASMPIHLIIEEAHRYVQNDQDEQILGYNIFNRITKEGRKYGIILGLITQRPSELSETTISQCGNFVTLRIVHPKDLAYVEQMIPYMTEESIKRLQTLPPGYGYGFGSAFKLSALIKFDLPNPTPDSQNAQISSAWFK